MVLAVAASVIDKGEDTKGGCLLFRTLITETETSCVEKRQMYVTLLTYLCLFSTIGYGSLLSFQCAS